MFGGPALRVADEIGDDVGIEQVAHQSSTGSGAASGIGGKLLVERRQGRQQRQQGFRRSGLDDQPFTLLAHDGVFAGQLELAGDAHCLVSAVLKELDMSLRGHGHSSDICFSIC